MDTLCVYVILVFAIVGCVFGDTKCPDTWIPFQGSCYLFGHDQGLTYNEAEHFCRQHGSHLVHVNDMHEDNFLRDMMTRFKPASYWVGLDDQLIEGEWRWLDTDTSPSYTDWSPDCNYSIKCCTDSDKQVRGYMLAGHFPYLEGAEFRRYLSGEPESAHGSANEDCAGFYIQLKYHWVDTNCNTTWQPMCEKRGSNVEVVG